MWCFTLRRASMCDAIDGCPNDRGTHLRFSFRTPALVETPLLRQTRNLRVHGPLEHFVPHDPVGFETPKRVPKTRGFTLPQDDVGEPRCRVPGDRREKQEGTATAGERHPGADQTQALAKKMKASRSGACVFADESRPECLEAFNAFLGCSASHLHPIPHSWAAH